MLAARDFYSAPLRQRVELGKFDSASKSGASPLLLPAGAVYCDLLASELAKAAWTEYVDFWTYDTDRPGVADTLTLDSAQHEFRRHRAQYPLPLKIRNSEQTCDLRY